jgi:hypothetical protein
VKQLIEPHIFTVWRYSRGGWTRNGKPVTVPSRKDAERMGREAQTPCTHRGQCLYPFKKCDGGTTYSIEKGEV